MPTKQIELGPVPHTRPHLMADYLELSLVFCENDQISISDSQSIFRDGVKAFPEDEEAAETEAEPDDLSSAESNMKAQEQVLGWFRNLKYRSKAFAEFYPFHFDNDVLKLNMKLTKKQLLYLFFLICSRMRCFDGSTRNKLAALFEKISAEALRRYIPQANIRIFGARSKDRDKHYGHKLQDAFRVLANDLKEELVDKNVKELKNNNTGDYGLDLVAYIDFKDDAMGKVMLFGQCAARETDWPNKALEAHPLKLSRFFHFNHNPANVLFIPLCYRQPSGNWVDASAHGAILLDRLRLCQLLGNNIPKDIYKLSIQNYLKAYRCAF